MSDRSVFFLGRRFFASGSRSRLASFISLLAMGGLVMGVALLIVVMSVMNGFDREMRDRILALVPHVQLFQEGGVRDWQPLAARLSEREGVRAVTPFTRLNGMLAYRGEMAAATIQGLDPAHPDPGMAGLLGVDLPEVLGEGSVLLSRSLASRLGIEPGARLTLLAPRSGTDAGRSAPRTRALRVAAIFDTHTAEDAGMALVTLDAAGAMAGLGARPQALRLTLEDVFAARETGYSLVRTLPPDFSFVDWLQTHGNLYQAIQLSRQMVGLLVFLIIAVAAFNVVSMLVMTVVDKKPAIAILKTQGAGNGAIMGVFFIQGSLIGLWGCFLGVLLGVPMALLVPDLVAWVERVLGLQFLSTDIYPIDYLPSALRWPDVALVVGVALALNFAATLYPAWKAVRVRPAQVLRYE